MTFFVACNGSDDWSGRLSQPDDSGSDGPFATIARARDAVRFLSKDERSREPVSIVVRGGTYLLEEALCFGPEDSGVEAAPVTYRAYPEETPILSGGRRITGWTPAGLPQVKRKRGPRYEPVLSVDHFSSHLARVTGKMPVPRPALQYYHLIGSRIPSAVPVEMVRAIVKLPGGILENDRASFFLGLIRRGTMHQQSVEK
jgi:hypothetical protein